MLRSAPSSSVQDDYPVHTESAEGNVTSEIRLPGQCFQVLARLLSQPGELVTREELQRKLWPAESFGDFEHG
jgi:DNA-binding response OmpR family regulator